MDTFANTPEAVKVRESARRKRNDVLYAKSMSDPWPQADVAQLRIPSVVDHVYAALRERILSGEIPRGSRLRQVPLAEALGVSRTPLREALRRLAAEGFVELSPRQGATVSRLDLSDMRQAWAARVALEPGAARLAAQHADGPAIERMRRAVERQRAVGDDPEAGFAANREFHLALVAASGNPHLMRFAETLWVPRIGVPIFQAQAADGPDGAPAWADEHERITDAIAAGDAGLAEHLTRSHVAGNPPVAIA
jgi:DNA-binding GntR family transcriptional regulator